MSETGLGRLRILELIQQGVISADAGRALLGELDGASAATAAAGAQDVAVVGVSGRFPDAADVGELWENLAAGRDSVREMPAHRWDVEEHFDPDPLVPDKTYCKWGSILDDVDLFDPAFFSMSPREARLMDPQQRLFLMEAWRALEDAGYSDRALDGTDCHVYVGAGAGDYHHLLRRRGVPLEGYTFMGTHPAVLASRISYYLNLKGPSVAVDTSCSSSLMALHLACEALRTGKCDLALAGGVAVLVTPELHVLASKAGMLSPHGRCRTFDDGADGFVPGEAVGVVVLERLATALANGHRIYGVIAASGVNQDGKTTGITAPSGPSQTAVEVETYRRFGIDPAQISYIECHGTGTRLGDPIEVDALTQAFSRFTDRKGFCALGSIKSNFGHTLTAAGIAGLIKVLLCLEHRQLVPSLHVETPNRYIRFGDSPFFVNTELSDWEAEPGRPRLAAVSSFGFSGTNVHVVIREAPAAPPRPAEEPGRWRVCPVSAKSEEVLGDRLRQLHAWLAADGGRYEWRDIAYTLGMGRSHFGVRDAFVARGAGELAAALGARLAGATSPDTPPETPPEAGSLAELAELYRSGGEVDFDSLYAGEPCRPVPLPTYPFAREPYWVPVPDGARPTAPRPAVSRPAAHQPAAPGLNPRPGEEVVVRRTLRPDDAVVRDHVVLGKPLLPAAGHLEMVHGVLRELLGDGPLTLSRVLWLRPVFVEAAVELQVAVKALGEDRYSFELKSAGGGGAPQLHSRGEARRGAVSAEPLELEEIRARCPQTLDAATLYDRFRADGIGYGPTFSTVREIRYNAAEALATLVREGGGEALPAGMLDGAVQSVAALEWDKPGVYLPFAMDGVHVLRPIPDRCRVHVRKLRDGGCSLTLADTQGRPSVVIEEFAYRELEEPVATRLYLPEWRPLEPLDETADPAQSAAGRRILVAAPSETQGLDEALALLHRDAEVTVHRLEGSGPHSGSGDFTPALEEAGEPDRIYFLGGLAGLGEDLASLADLERSQELGVRALFRLVKELLLRGLGARPLDLTVLTRDVHAVVSEDHPRPFAASLLGLTKSLAKEQPAWRVRCVDVSSRDLAGGGASKVAAAVAAEPPSPLGDEVALRGGRRWGRVLRLAEVPAAASPPYRRRGTYLIVGGAGGIGSELALHLARTAEARVVLVGRRAATAELEAKLGAVEAAGGEAMYLEADVTDDTAMAFAVAAAKERFGTIHGAFHSALVLRDGLLATLDEATFEAALAPKVTGSVVLARALAGEPLEQLIFFSSAQSFSGNPGQANYSAACTFKDAFAAALGRAGLPVTVVNWGYWGEVGIVAKAGYRKRMEAVGVHSISSEEGMDAVDRILAHGLRQAVPLKAERPALVKFGVAVDELPLRLAAEAPQPPPWRPLAGREEVPSPDLAALGRAHDELDALGARLLVAALQEMGALRRAGEEHSTEGLARALGIVPAHRRLWQTLLEILAAADWLEGDSGRWVSRPEVETIPGRDLAGEKRRLAEEHPAVAAHAELLWACVGAYPRLLRGEVTPTEVMFPGSSMELVEGVYRGDPIADHLNELAAQAVLAHLEARLASPRAPERLRVLEVGAGTGGTSARLLEALDPLAGRLGAARLEYVYTDVSMGFLKHGRQQFGAGRPHLVCRRLDIEKEPVGQGFEAGGFDVVVAANVLHATRRLGGTLGHVSRLLAPGGWLVLSETTAFSPFATLTFGLLEGWWRWEDGEARVPGSPLASPETWERLLLGHGFSRVAVLGPHGESGGRRIGQRVMVAERGAGAEVSVQPTQPAQTAPPDQAAPAVKAARVAEAARTVETPAGAAGSRAGSGADAGEVEALLAQTFAAALGRSDADLDPDQPFTEYGVDSIILVELVNSINDRLGIELKPTALFDHPTLAELAGFIAREHGGEVSAASTAAPVPVAVPAVEPVAEPVAGPGAEEVEALLAQTFAAALGRSDADLDPDQPFTEYGVDSIILVELVNSINGRLEIELKPTALFDHPTLAELARHIHTEHGSDLQQRLRQRLRPEPAAGAESPPAPGAAASPSAVPTAVPTASPSASPTPPARRRVAVVGLAARFGGAGSADELWRNLSRGVCSIREVPPERWDADRYYDPDPRTPGKTNSRWGGFADDVDAFDPLFFNMSGKEAEMTDPQQRLFLEACWTALEDAGYASDAVSGLSCGVFVGAPSSDYATEAQHAGIEPDAQVLMGNDTAILSARISYLLNLRGPSLPVNTACSSSLVALHLACQAIETGQCEMALAGGVCLFISPSFYLSAAKAGMLSPDGLCKAFDQGANGFVPGDGTGVVVLKDLDTAVRDGDLIYGVLLATETNQDGKTNGITAPSSRAQTEVELAAYRKAGISPETLSLIEAHGTGTALGDPIEVEALSRAFSEYTDRKQFCAIGSVKTNLGHTGQAAGIAGLIKVLLALRHELIPPSLHFEKANERIQFEDTPFYVPTSPTAWPRRPGVPRRAAVSSFGYSGTNAHVVVEEPPRREPSPPCPGPHLFLVSAKTEEALAERLADLEAWLDEEGREGALADIAFTLHAGRKHFPERAAVVAADRDELRRALGRARSAGNERPPRLDRTEKRRQAERLRGELAGGLPEGASRREALERMADLYQRGLDLELALLYPAGRGRRVALPTYPFARERYWIPVLAPAVPVEPPAAGTGASPEPAGARRHPLLARELPGSAAAGERGPVFVFEAARDQLFAADHIVGGQPILAAAVSLEMARAAGSAARGVEVTAIREVTWRRPLPSRGEAGLEMRLRPEEGGSGGALRFDLDVAGQAAPRPPGATGVLVFATESDGDTPGETTVDLEAVRRRCGEVLSGDACYERFREIGFDYGPGFRVLRQLVTGEGEVLARLELPESLAAGASGFILHPALLDGAVQSLIGLAGSGEAAGSRVPYTLAELEIRGSLPRVCHAHLTRRREGGDGETYDLALTDDAGRVRAALRGLGVVRTAGADGEVLRFRPVWSPRALPAAAAAPAHGATLIFDTGGEAAARLRAERPREAVTLVVPGPRLRRVGERDWEMDPGRGEDYAHLLDALAPEERPSRILMLWEGRGEPWLLGGEAAPGVGGAPDLSRGFEALLHLSRAWIERRPGGPVSLAFVHPLRGDLAPPHLAALGAFARTLRLEHPDIRLVSLGLPAGAGGAARLEDFWERLLAEVETPPEEAEVRWDAEGTRRVKIFEELPAADLPGPGDEAAPRLRQGGVYVLTGGAGGLGLLFARRLARLGAKLLLIGRSPLGARARGEVEHLAASGAEILYEQADVTDGAALGQALERARNRFGALHGVVHAAGVVRDAFLLHKTAEQAREVLAAKVAGAVELDRLTRDDRLDFLVFFSSVVSVAGNVGQADYAFANAFLDELAAAREALRRAGRRWGKTLAIDWPAWAEGGMRGDAAQDRESRRAGLQPLAAEEGWAAFGRALGFDGPQIVVVKGEPAVVRRALAGPGAPPPPPARASQAPAVAAGGGEEAGEALRPAAETYLQRLLAEELRVPAARIKVGEPLEAYGIDSVMVMSLSRRLEQDFGELPKTLFFEYQSLRELASYFVERHAAILSRRLAGPTPEDVPEKPPAPAETRGGEPVREAAKVPDTSPARISKVPGTSPAPSDAEAVAVVGVAGRYPMAEDLEAFWSNLAQGRDCITEIPPDRWPLEGFYDPQAGKPGKSYSKWGGFLSDVDKFDPLFFNIAPNEADMMDPQERLFLEIVWHLLESAGHTRRGLAGGRTGVFVGVMYGHYQLLPFDAGDGRMGMSSYASIANRVSYFFNFRGPSMALDTMCSSSLTALHLASESLRRGECDSAVAGGVNLSIHPRKYLQLSLGRFASTDGRCRSFGDGGDGYVPGEGVGAVLLRPLEAALADGDTIYAVIRGSALNHGGKTNGYTVPNPRAQSQAIVDAMRRAGVSPSQLGYLEAHGTGTALGDPIEIAALSKAFAEIGVAPGTVCPIGSVKSAVGHLESAAGIAAVTKVLLQMRHRTLVPSLHAETLNPNIDFTGSPFVVQRRLAEWKPPVAEEGDGARRLPRLAGVSSFGAGGSNAHVILEEVEQAPLPELGPEPQLIVLSARTREQLTDLAERLAGDLERRLAPPAGDWRSRLREDLLVRVSELLGLRDGDLGPDDDLSEAGLDDVARARLGTLVGEAYGLEWEDDPAPEVDTVRALGERLAQTHGEPLRLRFGGGEAPAVAPPLPAPRLADVAYTLQVGREAMVERLAFAASDLAEAVRRLRAFAAGEPPGAGFFTARVQPGEDEGASPVLAGGAGEETLRALLGEGALERIAELWVEGAEVEWPLLHPDRRRRVALPGYPFARERHWLTPAEVRPAVGAEPEPASEPQMDADSAAVVGPEPPLRPQAASPAPQTLPEIHLSNPDNPDNPDHQETPMAPATHETSGTPNPSDEIRTLLVHDLVVLASELIGLEPERMDARVNIGDYGFESVALKELADRISSRYGVAFSPTVFFERSGLAGSAGWLLDEYGERVEAFYRSQPAAAPEAPPPAPAPAHQAESAPAAAAEPVPASAPAPMKAAVSPSPPPVPARGPQPGEGLRPEDLRPAASEEPIAVIGMSGRFPQSRSPRELWEHLQAGRDLVTEIPQERWDWRDYDNDELPEEERCGFHWGSFVDDVDKFDARFFGILPSEAEAMDPQQRLFLQAVWEAFEDAGHRPSDLAGTNVGLFAGVQFSDYQHLLHESGVLSAQSGLGNEHSILLNRISFLLDLRGPSEPVNTACSSALVAVHRAVRSLRSGESSMAVAGGIALNLSAASTVAAGMMGLLSPDGKCKTLDRSANGYVKGEGLGAVVLKPLSRALADGDHVYAVIRGTAVNHGGRAASLTAPNSAAQAALIRAAVDEAGVGPETLGYIELHGTGTELGDPVEINGLKSAFRQLAKERGVAPPPQPYCGIGSVKTNLGHLEPASGIAGMIKVILAMQHETLPATIHLQELNPYIDLDGSPFYAVDKTQPWKRIEDTGGRPLPLRAGVSSFGFGGVNSHVLLEETPASVPPPALAGDRLFVFSAKTEEALTQTVRRFLEHLESWETEGEAGGAIPDPADVAFTLQRGREEMEERLACVARDLGELRRRLDAWSRGETGGEHVHRGRVTGAAREAPDTADLAILARHWVHGGRVDWSRFEDGGRQPRRVSLPTYPFERKRYWFTVPEGARAFGRAAGAAASTPAEVEEEILFGKQYVLAELKEILADKLKLASDDVDVDTELQEYGIDSMISGMIMQAAQERFHSQVPLNAIMEHPTLRSLSNHIYEEYLADDELPGERRVHRRKRSAEEASPDSGKKRVQFPPELLPIQTKGSGQPSFWVHGAAGYSAWFQNLSEALGPEFPIYAFQARGTDGYSMPQTLDEMVDHYVHCVRLVQPEGPYFLGGYSFGGLIAIEMARKLHEEGETIRHLVMFDTYPATQEVFDRHFGRYDEDFLQFYLANYFLRIDQNPELAIRPEHVAHIPKRLQLAEIAKLVKERGQKRISADEIYKYLRGGLACSEHAEGIYQMYEMRPYDASDMLFFKATDGFTGKASAVYWESRDILAGYDYPQEWRESMTGELQVVELDSDHLNMLEEPTLTPAARHIEALLREPPAFDMDEYMGFKDAFDKVTRFGHELLATRFHGSAALPAAGETFSRDELFKTLEVIPQYGRLFHASVDILEREGFVRREGDRLAVTSELEAAAFSGGEEEIAARIGTLVSEHPEIKDYLPLLRVCQGAVLEVMNGSRDATDVMFPGGSMKYVAELYKGNLQTDFYNRLVAERVQEHVRHHVRRFPYSKVQLFEVGAGTGGTSAFIFQSLTEYAEKLRYLYTDIGSAFLQMSKQQFSAQYPYIEFLNFDVERPPETQGFEPHSMDVVIASNVLHTTHHIDVTLEQCARLLKPGGVIVINELTQRLDYNTLTFGLTTGWWLYEDEDLRLQGSPLLGNVDWARMLKNAGFGEVEIVGVPNVDLNDLPQSMIAATKLSPAFGAKARPVRETAEVPAVEREEPPLDLVAVDGSAAGERDDEPAGEGGES